MSDHHRGLTNTLHSLKAPRAQRLSHFDTGTELLLAPARVMNLTSTRYRGKWKQEVVVVVVVGGVGWGLRGEGRWQEGQQGG